MPLNGYRVAYLDGDKVEVIAEGIFQSVVRYVDRWQHLPDSLPTYSPGRVINPGRRVRVFTADLESAKLT